MKTIRQLLEVVEDEEKEQVVMTTPLFIRLLEYAREDAKTDMDLHKVAENVQDLVRRYHILDMSHYNRIVKA